MYLIGVMASVWWIEWYSATNTRFAKSNGFASLISYFSSRLILATLLAGVLWSLGFIGFSIFSIGVWDIPVKNLSWLGIQPSENWIQAFWGIIIPITIVTFFSIYLPNRKTISFQKISFKMLIAVIIFAAINAWIEELCFRFIPLSFIGVNSDDAIWISAIMFGLPHYFGFPSRTVGVLLATFLGWLLAQMTTQTGGIAGAFMIHWIQDIVIILLLCASSSQSRFSAIGERYASSQDF